MSMDLYEQAEKDGAVIPEASDTGAQKGRVPPALRKHARYEAVSLAEAEERMAKRAKGELPPIANGMDTPGEVDDRKAGAPPPNTGAPENIAADSPTAVDGVETSLETPEDDGDTVRGIDMETLTKLAAAGLAAQQGKVAEVLDVDALSRMSESVDPFLGGAGPGTAATPIPAPQAAAPAKSETDEFLESRIRVSFGVDGGTYTVPAISVVQSDTGLVVMLPDDGKSVSFMPALGSRVVVSWEDRSCSCFFPGIHATIGPLKLTILGFVYEADPDGKD